MAQPRTMILSVRMPVPLSHEMVILTHNLIPTLASNVNSPVAHAQAIVRSTSHQTHLRHRSSAMRPAHSRQSTLVPVQWFLLFRSHSLPSDAWPSTVGYSVFTHASRPPWVVLIVHPNIFSLTHSRLQPSPPPCAHRRPVLFPPRRLAAHVRPLCISRTRTWGRLPGWSTRPKSTMCVFSAAPKSLPLSVGLPLSRTVYCNGVCTSSRLHAYYREQLWGNSGEQVSIMPIRALENCDYLFSPTAGRRQTIGLAQWVQCACPSWSGLYSQ